MLISLLIITRYFSRWRDQRSLCESLLRNNQRHLWLTTPTRITILPYCVCLIILVSILWAAGCQVKNCSFCRTVKRCGCRTTTCIPAWYCVLFPLNMFSLLAYICGFGRSLKERIEMSQKFVIISCMFVTRNVSEIRNYIMHLFVTRNVSEFRNYIMHLFVTISKYWFHMCYMSAQNKMGWFTLYIWFWSRQFSIMNYSESFWRHSKF